MDQMKWNIKYMCAPLSPFGSPTVARLAALCIRLFHCPPCAAPQVLHCWSRWVRTRRGHRLRRCGTANCLSGFYLGVPWMGYLCAQSQWCGRRCRPLRCAADNGRVRWWRLWRCICPSMVWAFPPAENISWLSIVYHTRARAQTKERKTTVNSLPCFLLSSVQT